MLSLGIIVYLEFLNLKYFSGDAVGDRRNLTSVWSILAGTYNPLLLPWKLGQGRVDSQLIQCSSRDCRGPQWLRTYVGKLWIGNIVSVLRLYCPCVGLSPAPSPSCSPSPSPSLLLEALMKLTQMKQSAYAEPSSSSWEPHNNFPVQTLLRSELKIQLISGPLAFDVTSDAIL